MRQHFLRCDSAASTRVLQLGYFSYMTRSQYDVFPWVAAMICPYQPLLGNFTMQCHCRRESSHNARPISTQCLNGLTANTCSQRPDRPGSYSKNLLHPDSNYRRRCGENVLISASSSVFHSPSPERCRAAKRNISKVRLRNSASTSHLLDFPQYNPGEMERSKSHYLTE